MYFEDLNLNQNKIVNLADPADDKDAATKGCTDSKVANMDLIDYVKRDGFSSMTGDLNMNDKKITELETQNDISNTDYPNYVKDLKMAVNKDYVNSNFLKLDDGKNDYDLKQKVIKNTEPFYDGLFFFF